MRWGLVILGLLTPTMALADIVPAPDRADPRVLQAEYIAGAAIRVQVAVGQNLTVLLPRNEQVVSVELSEPLEWSIKVDQETSDSFVLSPLRPAEDSQAKIVTKSHTYNLALSSDPSADPALYLRILSPGQSSVASAKSTSAPVKMVWKLSGNRELMPSSIRDDGEKTYVEWNADQAIPAVLAIDRLGREEMINAYMRGSVFTIDRVYDHLVFRLDKVYAEARRKKAKSQ